MRISKRRLQRIIKEETQLLNEQQKWDRMILQEGKAGPLIKKAFDFIAKKGPEAAKWVFQFVKSKPEILQTLVDMLVKDEETAAMIKGLLPGGEEEAVAEPAAAAATTESLRRRRRRRSARY